MQTGPIHPEANHTNNRYAVAMIPVTTFAKKQVAVFGLGGSGLVTAKALMAGGAIVSAWDDGQAARDAAAKEGVPLVDLATARWTSFSALVLAPGVPLTHPAPHWTVGHAKSAKVPMMAMNGLNGAWRCLRQSMLRRVLRRLRRCRYQPA